MTIKEGLKKSVLQLKESDISEPIVKSRIILAFIINKTKEYLVINEERELADNEKEKFEESINRLIQGEPIQHITGKQEFMKMNFTVNRNVLIPRQETEILVEEIMDIIKCCRGRFSRQLKEQFENIGFMYWERGNCNISCKKCRGYTSFGNRC